MTPLEMVAVVVAGVFAGGINTVVGSGTLVTFPVLLAVGYPPVVANVSNSLGLVPGSLSGAFGYRNELKGQAGRVKRLLPASILGGIVGAILLVTLPEKAFSAIVPVLIVIALVLVVLQPWLNRKLSERTAERPADGGLLLWFGVFAAGIYGGYFGAAQGVLVMGMMGVLVTEHLQRLNALKNVLTAFVNLVAGILFIFIAHVAWLPVLLLAVGSVVGGQIGAKVGRKLPPVALRAVIVVVGLAAIAKLLLG
ncbi:sulfite exporter TauE/SafE family protein [Umezawaea sp. Da 62-37]|uniref:sulfite exporter TauE/SafE family protein n=1 Tax=Umezawaea sp. Da 62-37 TaxID=3075927 RepID=UPI0028F70DB9|nr:sulfite exporter TauE/SafE family protein [Umezawaea sp. Da 62-37]WNV91608.1 sulfite exporter TauE/SafE family protein [Umezawaea sp. Da 62-37]